MEHQFPNQENNTPPTPREPKVQSYTAPSHDRYNVLTPTVETTEAKPPKKKKTTRTVPLSTAIATSIVASVVSSLLGVLVVLYGMNVSDMLLNNNEPSTSSASPAEASHNNTTNIVVDGNAQTSAEAVAQKAGPSVVGVVVTGSVNYYFFGESDTSSEGSGIIYSQDGYIITNYHVIENAVEGNGVVTVYLPTDIQNPLQAQVVGCDVNSDLAVLKVNKTDLTPIELGNSDELKVGQTAIAIGNPGGMDFMGSVSMGIISGLNRTLQLDTTSGQITLIQTDAAINPGNSGGALTDIEGKLIGVNSAKMASSNYEGMGFAIPVNDVVEIADRIIKNENAPKPYLGLEISTYYTGSTLKMMGYPEGVVVSAVSKNSPAAKAGIIRSDIITHVNDVAVTSYSQFDSEKSKYTPGQTIQLTIYRKGETFTKEIVLGTANE